MSALQGDRLSSKLKRLFEDSLELGCSKFINWNFYKEQTDTLDEFFHTQFSKNTSTYHEISKNLFKDYILKSSSHFAEELWKTKLKDTLVGKKYCSEIQKMFEIKKTFIKTETEQTPAQLRNNSNDFPKKTKFSMSLSQNNDINLLKKQLESKLNSGKTNNTTTNGDEDDEIDFSPRGQLLRMSTFSHVRLTSKSSFITYSQVESTPTEEKEPVEQEQHEEELTDDNKKCSTKVNKEKVFSLSLPDPKVLGSIDYIEDNVDEQMLPDIASKTNFLVELSCKTNDVDVKQIKTQVKLKNDLFRVEEEKEGDNIIYQSSSNKTIVYMTINLLLKKIVLENFLENNPLLIKGFIQQCSAFISLDNLIHKIISAFNYFSYSDPQNAHNLITFMNELIQHESPINVSSFREFSVLLEFYKKLSKAESLRSPASTPIKDIYAILKKLSVKQDKPKCTNKTAPATSNKEQRTLPAAQRGKYFYMFFHDAWDIANELTRITFALFAQINVKELLRAKFSKSKKKETSPNIVSSVERFDNLIYFIIEDILAYDRPRCRAQLIEKWIDVAWECRELGNYNDCLIITITFCNYLMRNLKKSWDRVGSEHMKKLAQMKVLCSFQNVYSKIKGETNERRQTGKQFVPYLGLLLKEISSLEEKYQYVKDGTLINFMKIEKVQNAIDGFFMFKDKPYDIAERAELKILEFLRPKTQDDLEKEGKMLEPEFKYETKNIYGKRQTRTDKFYYENILEDTEDELGMGKKTRMEDYS